MANQPPTVQDLKLLSPRSKRKSRLCKNVAPAAQAAPAAATTQVVYAKTPQTLGVDDLIDYLTKRGKDIYT